MIFSSRAGTKLNKDAVIKMNKKGFSFGELLVVTLIISVVAAASTPFINPKKQKKEVTKAPHGIFECYYKDGQLYEYIADNKTLTSRTPVLVTGRNYCKFTAPEANYFRFQLIGAGGNGYQGAVKTEITHESTDAGLIPLTELNLLSYNSKIPTWVKNYLRTNTVPISITVTSPMGDSGSTTCERVFKHTKCPNHSCLEGGTSDCPSNCFENNSYVGGSSGTGYVYSGVRNVGANSMIHYGVHDTYASFWYNNRQMVLAKSGTGENGSPENKNPANGRASGVTNTIGFTKTSTLSPITAPTCSTFGKTTAANKGSSGRVSVIPSSISYSRSVPRLSLELGMNGGPGRVENFTFPYLGGKMFKIKPAINSSKATEVSFGDTKVISAQSGENAPNKLPEAIRPDKQIVSSIGDNPVDYKPENVNDNSRILKLVSNNDTNLKSMIDKEKIYPGNGGYGSYPYLTSFTGLPIYQEVAGVERYSGTTSISAKKVSGNCLNDTTRFGNGKFNYYCRGTQGNSGAVRIVW